MNYFELMSAEEGNLRVTQTRARNAALQTFGNLTVLTQKLNSSVSNALWTKKQPELLSHSLLPINQQLQNQDVWNEAAIVARSNELLERALRLWPRS